MMIDDAWGVRVRSEGSHGEVNAGGSVGACAPCRSCAWGANFDRGIQHNIRGGDGRRGFTGLGSKRCRSVRAPAPDRSCRQEMPRRHKTKAGLAVPVWRACTQMATGWFGWVGGGRSGAGRSWPLRQAVRCLSGVKQNQAVTRGGRKTGSGAKNAAGWRAHVGGRVARMGTKKWAAPRRPLLRGDGGQEERERETNWKKPVWVTSTARGAHGHKRAGPRPARHIWKRIRSAGRFASAPRPRKSKLRLMAEGFRLWRAQAASGRASPRAQPPTCDGRAGRAGLAHRGRPMRCRLTADRKQAMTSDSSTCCAAKCSDTASKSWSRVACCSSAAGCTQEGGRGAWGGHGEW